MIRFLAGVLAGTGLALTVVASHEPSGEEMFDEMMAYRHCMQVAGALGCRMTPQDFVRYYELKRQLEVAD